MFWSKSMPCNSAQALHMKTRQQLSGLKGMYVFCLATRLQHITSVRCVLDSVVALWAIYQHLTGF